MDLHIPESFLEIMAKNQTLKDSILSSIKPLLEWIELGGNELPFFPEYTDHGIKHISNVLETISTLITENSLGLLTPEDISVLILAVVIHDCAMHIRPDGFLYLINKTSNRPIIQGLDVKEWYHEWEDYYSKSRRWDGKTLYNILGDCDKASLDGTCADDVYETIRRPMEMGDPDLWNKRYCKFIGEFIRRHHGRLAHDIALNGVPVPDNSQAINFNVIPDHIRDLSGLIARSHCLNLRDTFPYLESKYYGRVTCRHVHPVYLMVLLRISDYLDIEANRASNVMLNIRRLRSPLSKKEWKMHSSINDVRPDEHDNEALFIVAEPTDSSTFLKGCSLKIM